MPFYVLLPIKDHLVSNLWYTAFLRYFLRYTLFLRYKRTKKTRSNIFKIVKSSGFCGCDDQSVTMVLKPSFPAKLRNKDINSCGRKLMKEIKILQKSKIQKVIFWSMVSKETHTRIYFCLRAGSLQNHEKSHLHFREINTTSKWHKIELWNSLNAKTK